MDRGIKGPVVSEKEWDGQVGDGGGCSPVRFECMPMPRTRPLHGRGTAKLEDGPFSSIPDPL